MTSKRPPTPLLSLEAAHTSGQLSAAAAERIQRWLSDPCYAEFAERVAEEVNGQQWTRLEELFRTTIPFGTAGRRGHMYPIGTNAINVRTIGETVQGLADYVASLHSCSDGAARPRCAVGYDPRHGSQTFAELAVEILAAADFEVFFLDEIRSTPALSFAVRHFRCDCGVMITASHNPPADNAIKVFWRGGIQILPPHDERLTQQLLNVGELKRLPITQASAAGRVRRCLTELDDAYLQAVASVGGPAESALPILFSPLHGAGLTNVLPTLINGGFRNVEVFAPHSEPDADFPNVPDGIANPEDPRVFAPLIERAEQAGHELILASDPDADRIGCAVRASSAGTWRCLHGNQIATLLADYRLSRLADEGILTPQHSLITTLVTTDMLAEMADARGVACHADLPTGFKWIGERIEKIGGDRLVLACEEAHGYLVGGFLRDKDAAGAALLLAERAAAAAAAGRTLYEEWIDLAAQYGCHCERTIAVELIGAAGEQQRRAIMDQLRAAPPQLLDRSPVTQVRDYLLGRAGPIAGPYDELPGPRHDLLCWDTATRGNRVAIRPSGTEPKLKVYLFAQQPLQSASGFTETYAQLVARLDRLEQELRDLITAY